MTYQEAIRYLFSLEFFGIKLGLDNIRRLMELLGNPQNNLRIIHIAGTNGKGSVANYTANILQASGYKTGLYTSPHLVKFEERISIDGNLISEGDVTRLTERIKPLAEQLAKESNGAHPTFFEVTTAMALLYFFEQKVDFTVLEVGLGGRLDATNIVKTGIVVITNIAFDHMKQLGYTLKEIAREKAGIIKKNSTVITGATGDSLEEIRNVCKKQNATLITYPKDISYRNLGIHKKSNPTRLPEYQQFYVFGRLGDYPNLKTQMPGEHQLCNATLAIGAVESIILQSFPELFVQKSPGTIPLRAYLDSRQKRNQFIYTDEISEDEIPLPEKENSDSALSRIGKILLSGVPEGIKNTHWPGRLEVVKESPIVLLDGAHNEAGAKVLQKAIKEFFTYEKLYLVIGITEGKEAEKIIEILCPLADEVIVTSAKNHRVIAPEELMKQIHPTAKPVTIAKPVADAVKYVLSRAKANDLICISGSLYVVGEARPIFVTKE